MKCIKRFLDKLLSKAGIPSYQPQMNFDNWKAIEMEIFIEINKYRKENNLTAFKPEKFGHYLATDRIIDIVDFSHKGVGKAFAELTRNGFTKMNECLAFGYTNAESIVKALAKSEGHNRMILSNNTYGCVAYYDKVCVILIFS